MYAKVCISSLLLGASLFLFPACSKMPAAVIEPEYTLVTEPPPTEIPESTPAPEPDEPPDVAIVSPEEAVLSGAGLALILEFEGYYETPEAPDARYSGISWACGYDAHQNKASVIADDWKALPAPSPSRLAAVQPYYGRSAIDNLYKVKDIRISREIGMDVFNRIDAKRVYDQCQRAFPGFDELKQPARDALISLVFNRGPSMTGDSRREMREIPGFVKNKDYKGLAGCVRRMVRVWVGTEIYRGLYRRRYAEAKMIES